MSRGEKRVIETWEYASLAWLSKEAKINVWTLSAVLTKCRTESLIDRLYRTVEVPKHGGGKRVISVPDPDLLKVQKAINDRILKELPRPSMRVWFFRR